MTAKEYLSQAYLLDQQIQSKLSQIESLKTLATSVGSMHITRTPVKKSRNVSSMEDTILKIMEAERELDAEIDKLVDLKLEIAKTIAQVKDVTLRLILEKRYLSFETWNEIREELGFKNRWLLYRHEMALNVVQKILDRESSNFPIANAL